MAYHMDALERVVLTIKVSSDYQFGASIRHIAKKYGVSYKTVYNLLELANVEKRDVGRYKDRDRVGAGG